MLAVAHLLTDNIGMGVGKLFMKQPIEQYWPQHKVFFIGILVLFPEKLNGHEVNQWFYRPYFIGEDPNFIALELEEYRKAGYLEYEKVGALYKITSIDSQKAAADLIKYLQQWRHNKLLSLPAGKPPDAAHQRSLLFDAVARAYANNNEPRITLEDVYGKSGDRAYEATFWELVLSWQLLDEQVKIAYMDYGRRVDGLYDDDAQPLIDFTITDEKLAREIERRVAQEAKSATPTTLPDIVMARSDKVPTEWKGRVDKEGRQIIITIIGDNAYVIKQLDEDGTYDKFMDYVLHKKNVDIDIKIEEIRAIEGLRAVNNLSLLARYSGFVKPFKKAFFTTSEKGKVRFRRVAALNYEQVEAIKTQAKKV